MRTGQRDVHNTPLKRRLSINYEELETLKKSIKVSVLNELRAEMENVSDQDSIKDLVLSEIRTELMGIPNPVLLKASILDELRMELKASRENDSGVADRKLRELAGIQDGLVRELLDQKMLIRKLGTDIGNLTKLLEDAKNTVPATSPSVTFTLPEDPLDLPSLSRKPKQNPELRKENSAARRLTEFREEPAPLPDTSAKVQLKLREVEPAELDKEEVETKCEYIIAESGDKRRLKGNVRQQPSARTEPARQPPPRQSPSVRPSAPVRTDPSRARPADDYKCEYIIAEKTSKKHFIEESVDLRESEDAEIITCSRKNSRAY
ncbi:hypothetical protein RG963_00600 [Methanosarcina sp. Z-7115]|uniref:Uncharacterized protein n=1 Tax=Methanosarcina baikalica TaxID=3073890 RepID=A0ABU2CXL3_9EURY|nr:hypothetical protein [Methanosarcina sp. Z-7115]MDR7664302.1 hypothetical protein [Methanosarcina sp. Z-7115]